MARLDVIATSTTTAMADFCFNGLIGIAPTDRAMMPRRLRTFPDSIGGGPAAPQSSRSHAGGLPVRIRTQRAPSRAHDDLTDADRHHGRCGHGGLSVSRAERALGAGLASVRRGSPSSSGAVGGCARQLRVRCPISHATPGDSSSVGTDGLPPPPASPRRPVSLRSSPCRPVVPID